MANKALSQPTPAVKTYQNRSRDLTGETFHRLIVIGQGPWKTIKNGTRISQWDCLCQCGKSVVVPRQALTTGNTKSCGCLKLETALRQLKTSVKTKKQLTDLTGQKFHMLTVIKHSGWIYFKSGGRRAKWECQCECGRTAYVNGCSLRTGNTKSCGECHKIDIQIGASFKQLIVKSKKKITNAENGTWYHVWVCMCVCGKTVEATSGMLKQGNNTSCGCMKKERAKAMAENNIIYEFNSSDHPLEYNAWRHAIRRVLGVDEKTKKIIMIEALICARIGYLALTLFLEAWGQSLQAPVLTGLIMTKAIIQATVGGRREKSKIQTKEIPGY